MQPVGGSAPNIYGTSAGAYNNAVGATGAAMGMAMGQPTALAFAPQAQAGQAQARGYTPFMGSGQLQQATGGGYTAQGYDAAQMDAARDVTSRQLADTNLDPYMNPYTGAVVDQSLADLERSRLMQRNASEREMAAAGAFGGSRHGVADAETNRNYFDRAGALASNLRQSAFQNAQQAALTDIGNRMRGDLANQQADLTTGQFNTGAINRAQEFTAGAQNRAGEVGANNAAAASRINAQLGLQNQLAQMNAANTARGFGATADNAVSQFNTALGADMSRFNAGLLGDTSRFNATTLNDAGQRRFSNVMQGASQLGNLSNLGFGMGNTITGMQQQQGQQAQAMRQAKLDAALRQWQGYTGAGNLGLGNLQTGVASAPAPMSQTSTRNPGIFDYISAAAGFF